MPTDSACTALSVMATLIVVMAVMRKAVVSNLNATNVRLYSGCFWEGGLRGGGEGGEKQGGHIIHTSAKKFQLPYMDVCNSPKITLGV